MVERFARAHAEDVTVIGLGSHGSIELAREFVRERGVPTPRMLWDDEGATRPGLGVPREPAAVLVDERGRVARRWLGPFPEAEVLREARALGARTG